MLPPFHVQGLGDADAAIEAFKRRTGQSGKSSATPSTAAKESGAAKKTSKVSAARRKRTTKKATTPPEVALTIPEIDVAFANITATQALETNDFFPADKEVAGSAQDSISSYVYSASGPFGSGFYRRPDGISTAAYEDSSAVVINHPAETEGAGELTQDDTYFFDEYDSDDDAAEAYVPRLLPSDDVFVEARPSVRNAHAKALLKADKVQDALDNGADSWILGLTVLSGLAAEPAKLTWLRDDLLELQKEAPAFRAVVFTQLASCIQRVAKVGRELGLIVLEIKPTMSTLAVKGLVDKFNALDAAPGLLVAPIRVGLDAMAVSTATRVYLLEPSMNPSTEVDVAGGIRSDGRVSGNLFRRLCYRGSVEERIANLHARLARGDVQLKHGRVMAGEVESLIKA